MNQRRSLTPARVDRICFSILMTVYTLTMFVLFYRQAVNEQGAYFSDMAAYILEMQGLESGYSFPYPLFFKLGAAIELLLHDPCLSISVALSLLNGLSPIFLRHYLDDTIQITPQTSLVPRLRNSLVTFGLLFASVLVFPFGPDFFGIHPLGDGYSRYMGAFGQNPFHNATYIATRPFAIITFFLFIRILDTYEEEPYYPDYFCFSLALLLTTLTKPSFTFVLVPAAGLILLYRLIRRKGQNWKATLLFALTALPTFISLIYQYISVFDPSDTSGEHGIGFGLFEVWHIFASHVPIAMLPAIAFPLVVLIFNFKELKNNTMYRTSWVIFLMSVAEMALLYEKGFRKANANFAWGYMHGQCFLFIASIILVLQQTQRFRTASRSDRCKLCAEWVFFLWHVLSGLLIFVQYLLNIQLI